MDYDEKKDKIKFDNLWKVVKFCFWQHVSPVAAKGLSFHTIY